MMKPCFKPLILGAMVATLCGSTWASSLESTSAQPLTVAYVLPPAQDALRENALVMLNGMVAQSSQDDTPIRVITIDAEAGTSAAAQMEAAVMSGAHVIVGPLNPTPDMVATPAPLPRVRLVAPTSTFRPDDVVFAPARDEAITTMMEAALQETASQNPALLESRPVLLITFANEHDYDGSLAKIKTYLNQAHVPFEVTEASYDKLGELRQAWAPKLSAHDRAEFMRLKADIEANTQPNSNARKIRIKNLENDFNLIASQRPSSFRFAVLITDDRKASVIRNFLPRTLPVWGITATNPGSPEVNPQARTLANDLNGLRFVDAPLILRYTPESFEATFGTTMPSTLEKQRWFAYGLDAVRVAKAVAHHQENFKFVGESGTVTYPILSPGVVGHRPVVMQMRNGQLRSPQFPDMKPVEIKEETPINAIPEPLALPRTQEQLSTPSTPALKSVILP